MIKVDVFELPVKSWGSEEKVEAWMRDKQRVVKSGEEKVELEVQIEEKEKEKEEENPRKELK